MTSFVFWIWHPPTCWNILAVTWLLLLPAVLWGIWFLPECYWQCFLQRCLVSTNVVYIWGKHSSWWHVLPWFPFLLIEMSPCVFVRVLHVSGVWRGSGFNVQWCWSKASPVWPPGAAGGTKVLCHCVLHWSCGWVIPRCAQRQLWVNSFWPSTCSSCLWDCSVERAQAQMCFKHNPTKSWPKSTGVAVV